MVEESLLETGLFQSGNFLNAQTLYEHMVSLVL